VSGWLVAAILGIAVVYASVGHAGATGYIAVMTLAGLPPDVIRPTALVLNVCVATIASVQFARAGHLRRDLIVPLAAAGVPAAIVGGALSLRPAVFEGVLGVVLGVSAVRFGVRAVRPDVVREPGIDAAPGRAMLVVLGGTIGLVSGLTGVGGGVFLTPALVALRAAPVRQVAAVSAAFILVNSLAGLAGGLLAGRTIPPVGAAAAAAAIVGGAVGSQWGAFRLPVRALEGLMGVVLAIAAGKLLLPFVAPD